MYSIFHLWKLENVILNANLCTVNLCIILLKSVFFGKLVLQVMLAILIGLLTLLTWHFTRVYTTRSLNTLAFGLRHELLQRPILRMWNILNSTVEIATAQVKLSEYVIKRYSNPVNQAQQAEVVAPSFPCLIFLYFRLVR